QAGEGAGYRYRRTSAGPVISEPGGILTPAGIFRRGYTDTPPERFTPAWTTTSSPRATPSSRTVGLAGSLRISLIDPMTEFRIVARRPTMAPSRIWDRLTNAPARTSTS